MGQILINLFMQSLQISRLALGIPIHVDADRVVLVHPLGNQQFGPDPVRSGNEDGVFHM